MRGGTPGGVGGPAEATVRGAARDAPSLGGGCDNGGHVVRAGCAISKRVSEPLASFANRPPAVFVSLAESLRRLTETMLCVPALGAELADEVERIRAAIDGLERALAPHALHDPVPRMGAGPATQRPYYVSGVVLGPHHPLRPDLRIAYEDGVTHGTVRFGVTFEGPPGCVHGGFVAHFFDQILGQHNLSARIPAMTGTLSVRFRKGTPILRELSFDVRHERRSERKVITSGRLHAAGEVFSEAEGTFVVPSSASWAERA